MGEAYHYMILLCLYNGNCHYRVFALFLGKTTVVEPKLVADSTSDGPRSKLRKPKALENDGFISVAERVLAFLGLASA